MKPIFKKISIWISILFSITLSFYLWKDYSDFKNTPHYHANFWVFIEWERRDFSDEKYMEDVFACKVWAQKSPKDRVHLHENNAETIHVHHDWVTWGHFFANIWYNFWENYLEDDAWNFYQNNEKFILHFFINGKKVNNPFNTQILSKDVLLIAFSEKSEEEILQIYEPQISKNAWEYNTKPDPASCSWNEYNFFKNLYDIFGHSH